LCGIISLGCSSSVTVSWIPNRGCIAIFVEASGEQCLERCQEHVVLHHVVRIREVAGSMHWILVICANEATSLNKLRQLSSSVMYTSPFGIFTPHDLIADDALRDVAPRLWEGVFYFKNAIRCHGACVIVVSLRRFSRNSQILSGTMCRSLIPTFTQTGR
jgi:hypothetical protein